MQAWIVYNNVWKSERRVEYEENVNRVLGRDFFNNHAIDSNPVGYGITKYVTVSERTLVLA